MKGFTLLLASWIATGCATLSAPPSRDLLDARESVARARARGATQRSSELARAEAHLAAAEAAERRDPGSREARDRAYVASRMGECVRIAEAITTYRELLEDAKIEATMRDERLRHEVQRGAAQRAREIEARARRERQRKRLHRELGSAMGYVGELVWDEASLAMRFPAEALFVPHSTLLTIPAARRLRRVADALRGGLPVRLDVRVTDAELGLGRKKGPLAQKRAERIRAALLEYGVPADYVAEALGRSARGPGVEIVLREQPLVVPRTAFEETGAR